MATLWLLSQYSNRRERQVQDGGAYEGKTDFGIDYALRAFASACHRGYAK
jgi:hypothetical protein